jgi:hypothetical protein
LTPDRARRALVALRLVLGVTAYVRPDLAARAFGIDPDEGAATPSAVRLFGAREAAMGVALLLASGPHLRRWLLIGAGVDALDVATVVMGARSGRLGRTTVTVGAGLAAAAVGLGLRGRSGGLRRGGDGRATCATS